MLYLLVTILFYLDLSIILRMLNLHLLNYLLLSQSLIFFILHLISCRPTLLTIMCLLFLNLLLIYQLVLIYLHILKNIMHRLYFYSLAHLLRVCTYKTIFEDCRIFLLHLYRIDNFFISRIGFHPKYGNKSTLPILDLTMQRINIHFMLFKMQVIFYELVC